ncbi:MAG: hypothetical protein WC599_11410 [Bacteroidales bacterium]
MTDTKTNSKKPEELKKEQAELAFKYLLELRDHENQLMWTRSNILLLLQGGLLTFIAYNFKTPLGNNWPVLASLCVFGLFIAFLLWRITAGGSFWVDFWQSKLKSIEEIVFGNVVDLFRNHPAKSKKENPALYKDFKKMGYKSTRRTLRILSAMTILLWAALLIYIICSPHKVLNKDDLQEPIENTLQQDQLKPEVF